MKQILKNNVDTAPSSLLTHTPLYSTADQPPIGSLHRQLTCLLSGILTILGFLRVSHTELLLPFCQAAALVSQGLPDLSVFINLFLPPPDCFPTTRAPVNAQLSFYSILKSFSPLHPHLFQLSLHQAKFSIHYLLERHTLFQQKSLPSCSVAIRFFNLKQNDCSRIC